MSSSCCNGNCGCGSGCKCGSSCSGCKRNPELGYSAEKTYAETVTSGVGPENLKFEGSEMSAGAENDGCKCAPPCTCNPCTCK